MATKFTGLLLQKGLPLFSPIAYVHPFATAYNLPGDADTWLAFNMPFLRRADAVFCLQLDGWQDSKGVKIELNLAKALFIPVLHYDKDFNPVEGTLDTPLGQFVAQGRAN